MATGDKIYLADKPTLDSVLTRVNKIGHYEGFTVSEEMKLPYNFYGGSAVVFEDEIHILGSSANPTTHYKYDGLSWKSVSTLPINLSYGAAVIYQGSIHILANYNFYKYENNNWVKLTNITTAFSPGSAAAVSGELIHVIAGNKHLRWDGVNWVDSQITTNFSYGSLVVHENLLYMINSNTFSYYYAGSWSNQPSLPQNFSNGTAVSYRGNLHLFGSAGTLTMRSHSIYTKNGWLSLESLPETVLASSSVVYKDAIHILGGYGSETRHVIYNYKSEWLRDKVVSKKYYLPKDTKIICDKTKTIISENVIEDSSGYVVANSGLITIKFYEDEGGCYTIV